MHITDERFEDLVVDEFDRLPPELVAMTDNVAVLIAPEHEEGLLGLYEGVPHTERDQYGFLDLPDRVTLFRWALCEHAASEAELRHEIRVTLVHELAHHVGIDDDRLHELGVGVMSRELVISAVGEDRPGIVATVAEALRDHGCNLLDTSMTILRGRFAMMLVVTGPEDVAALEQALEAATAPLDVTCTVAAAPAAAVVADGEPYVLSVYGADRPGIVARTTRLLADHGVNITDLSTRLIGEQERPVYAMVLDLVVPAAVVVDALTEGLEVVARELGVHCRLHPADEDVL